MLKLLSKISKDHADTELLEKLPELMDQLRPIYKDVLYYRFWENQTSSEIAQNLSMNFSEAEKILNAALDEMRILFIKNYL